MATALDLLMSAKEDVNLLSEESDICTIDAKTRTIFVPSTIVVGGVQSDKNAERIKFSCPKIVGDNLDLSKFSVRINFENVSSVDFNVSIKDQYICDDVAVDGENVTFSWLIGRNAARYMGTVRFIVCAVKTDSDSNISVEWNTAIAEVPVLEGIEIDQPQIGQEEKDVINQLLELTKNTSAEAVQNVNSAKEQAIKDIQSVSQPDTTLTIEGGLAEAKATGEAIGSLKEDLGNYYFKAIIKPVYTTQEIVVGVINDSNGQVVDISGSSTVYLQELEADELKISSYQCKCVAFYDNNKIFLSTGNTDANGWATTDIPLNAKYVSYSWADDSGFKIVYGNEHQNPLYEIGVPTTLEEKIDNITPNMCSFLTPGLNLFNKNEELQNKFLNDGIISDFDGYCVSDYIPVKKNNTYVCNKDLPKYDLFDSEKKFIKEFAYTAGQPIVPTKDGYIVICYYSPTSDKHTSNEMMVCMGDTVPTDYKSFCYYPKSTAKYPVDFNKTWYKDKYICTFGDSNTANARWQDFMCNSLKCTYQNCGIGGSSMAGTDEHAMWTDFRVGQISEKTNAILIMAGTNDGASSRDIGTMSLDNADTNTFVGAYNTCLRKIYKKMGATFPVFLFTPIPCFNTITYPRIKETANAVKEIGVMWSLPVIDAQNECGINVANKESLYASGGVHVDYEGGKMLASLVVGVLKAHEPID